MTVSRFNFRAYVKKYNKIYRVVSFFDNEYFHLEDYKSKFVIKNDNKEHLDPYSFSINEIELMQSTGLVDKNGKEIFEGDVVVGNCQQFVVCFQDCQFVLKKIHRYEEKEYDYSLCCFEKHNIEIIGNIYENKELLGE